MSRVIRSLASDVVALALGFSIVALSPKVIAASRVAEPMRSSSMVPSVWLLSPSNGQAVSGNVTVSATASQDTETIQFQLNGASLGPAITSGACSLTWNTGAVNDGSYSVTVVGYDINGNAMTSSPVTVTVENTPPQIFNVGVSGISSSSAMVTWMTNQPASTGVDYGPSMSYVNSTPLNVTMTTQHNQTLVGLTPSTTYHFRVSSWNGVGLLAASSDFTFTTAAANAPPPSAPNGGETPAPPPVVYPGGCTTPDPFTAMGGGTCLNGGWFPPAIPSLINGQTPPANSPAPTPSAGGCLTADPFVAIGGGTCVNGGWLPRNVATPPAPQAPAAPAPPAPATPVAGGCTTSDPFVALGGGTCLNGGWFPPGMLPAPGNVVVSPPPASAPGGCRTPDPFLGITGLHGVCSNGGWYPVRNGG